MIWHALQVREAWSQVDYHAFFTLYDSCPNYGKYLMDHMVPSMRFKGLQRICQAYRPSVDASFVLKELGLDKDGSSFGIQWLRSCGCLLSDDEKSIRTEESTLRESELEQKKSLI